MRWVDGPDREKLLAAVPEADALLVRSATTVDAEVLAAAPKLKIVARAGVGLDNVDVDAATARGVLVVNAPTSNIHSAAEHALALLLAAARQIAAADASLREHTWKRSSVLGHRDFRQDRRRRRAGPDRPVGRPADRGLRHPRRRLRPVCGAGARRAARHRTAVPRRAAGPCRLHLGAPAEDARDGGPDRQGGAGQDQAGRHHRQRRARRSGGRGGAGRRGQQRPRARRRSRRVLHRTVHRQPAVRAAAGGGHAASGGVHRRGPGPGRHRRGRKRAAGAGGGVRSRRGQRRRRRGQRRGGALAGPGAQARGAGRRAVRRTAGVVVGAGARRAGFRRG